MCNQRSTELNELLKGRPSRFAFRSLRTLLNSWPEDAGRDEAMRSAGAALAPWPAPMRHVSAHYNRGLSSGT